MNMEPIIPLMELCGTEETVGTPVGPEALPASQSRHPPSPFQLTISPIEVLHTPRTKSEAFVTATPSPALLNPLAQDYWSESSARRPIFFPRLESSQARIIRRLQDGFSVKLHDGSCSSLVKISLVQDSSCLHVYTSATAETGDEKKSQEDEPLHSIAITDIERVEYGKESLNQQLLESAHPLKCFSIVSKSITDLNFECDSAQQRATIVSSLVAITSKGTLRMRPASLDVSREPIGIRMNLDGDVLHTHPASLSPMQRTRIYAESMAEGQELSLNYSEDEDPLDIPDSLQRRRSSTNAFSFADVVSQQSSEDDNMVVEHTDSMLAISFHEALYEWCTDDACTLDLTDVSASLGGIFHILGGRSAATQHVRVNSTEVQLQNSCMADFLNTPASIWADLPSTGMTKKAHNSTDGANKRIRNRASTTNAQALRWRQLRTEMTFESIVQSAQYRMTSIATSKSLDDFDRLNRRAPKSIENTSHGIFDLLSAKLGVVGSNVVTDDKDCDFYDSDPEDARLLMRNRGPRRVLAERLNKIEADEMRRSKKLDFSLCHANVKGNRLDEEQTNAIIEIMKSEQISLLWHPTPTQKHPNRTPQCVTAWVERGTYLLTQSFVQPKWMWKPAKELNLDTRRLNIAYKSPERVDLLEIARVQDSPEIDRQSYPFVHKRRSFTIETRTEVHVFEAQSVRDKKRIVFGLKLTISRLASLIMTRDSRAVEEFFEPVHSQVPGKEPEWASFI